MDIFLMILLIVCIAIGFFQGMIKLIIAIVAFYLSLVLGALYYPSMGDFLVRRLHTQRYVGEYVGFALVLFVAFIVLLAAGIYTFRYATLPGRLQYLDRIIGTVLGVLLGGFIVGIFALFVYNLMVLRGGQNLDFPLARTIGKSTLNSFLVQYFRSFIHPTVFSILSPILPSGAQLIFSVQNS